MQPASIAELERRVRAIVNSRGSGVHEDGPACLKVVLTILAVMVAATLLICGGLMWVFQVPLPAPEPYPGAVVNTDQHDVGNGDKNGFKLTKWTCPLKR